MPRSSFVGLKDDREGCGDDDYAAPPITIPDLDSDSSGSDVSSTESPVSE